MFVTRKAGVPTTCHVYFWQVLISLRVFVFDLVENINFPKNPNSEICTFASEYVIATLINGAKCPKTFQFSTLLSFEFS